MTYVPNMIYICPNTLEEAIDWQMQFGANCGIQITSEDMAS